LEPRAFHFLEVRERAGLRPWERELIHGAILFADVKSFESVVFFRPS
jgi:hypothetical protein